MYRIPDNGHGDQVKSMSETVRKACHRDAACSHWEVTRDTTRGVCLLRRGGTHNTSRQAQASQWMEEQSAKEEMASERPEDGGHRNTCCLGEQKAAV